MKCWKKNVIERNELKNTIICFTSDSIQVANTIIQKNLTVKNK